MKIKIGAKLRTWTCRRLYPASGSVQWDMSGRPTVVPLKRRVLLPGTGDGECHGRLCRTLHFRSSSTKQVTYVNSKSLPNMQ